MKSKIIFLVSLLLLSYIPASAQEVEPTQTPEEEIVVDTTIENIEETNNPTTTPEIEITGESKPETQPKTQDEVQTENEEVLVENKVLKATSLDDIKLPEAFYAGNTYDLLSFYPDSSNIIVKNITSTDPDFVFENQTSLTASKGNVVYYITYALLNETLEEMQTKTIFIKIEGEEIGTLLDGNYAYISELKLVEDETTESKYAISSGTAPWDNKTNGVLADGDDDSAKNNILRSFDTATYTVSIRNKTKEDSPYNFYQSGTLHFRFLAKGTKEEVIFDIATMGWLSSKKAVKYEVSEQVINGETYQVMNGSYLWEPADGNPAAIGESYQELGVAVTYLNKSKGDKVAPMFEFWLEHNDESEIKKLTAPELTITSAPRYNLSTLAGYVSDNSLSGTWDFSTGNDLALNKSDRKINGRLLANGFVFEIRNKDSAHGLKGCELPDGSPISFDIEFTSNYRNNHGERFPITDNYTPLIWSFEDHRSGNPLDGRKQVPHNVITRTDSPYNRGANYRSCFDGGNWKITQTGKNTATLTISDYKIDLNKLPYAGGWAGSDSYLFYNPNTIKHYKDIHRAVISSSELWLVQPYQNNDNTNTLVNEFGAGDFQIEIKNRNLKLVSSGSGAINETPIDSSNQMVRNDDKVVTTYHLESPGSWSYLTLFTKYHHYNPWIIEDALVTEARNNGKDIASIGQKISAVWNVSTRQGENDMRRLAYSHLAKFDSDAFEIIRAFPGGKNNKLYFAAKPDKTGWNHKGLRPDEKGYDDEMKQATMDDLIYFNSLKELEEQGYICVGLLGESRQISGFSDGFAISADFLVTSNPQYINTVSMITHECYAWDINSIKEDVAKTLNKDINSLTDADYNNYAQNYFPSHPKGSKLEDYPTTKYVGSYKNTPGIRNYEKARYDESGYAGGSSGWYYGDSVLIQGYQTTVDLDLVQKDKSNNIKQAYDMDSGQRVADFVLKPGAIIKKEGTPDGEIDANLYLEVTLPKDIKYIDNSSYIGGEYKQVNEGKQGIIENGQVITPEVNIDSKGNTTLRYTVNNVKIKNAGTSEFEPIYYSVLIGKAGDEENDVKNNQRIMSKVKVWSSKEQKTDFTLEKKNLDEKDILVTKNNAVSLSLLPDRFVYDKGESMGYIGNIGNNSANPLSFIASNNVPHNGDKRGSKFTGDLIVKDFRIISTELLDNLEIYYTSDSSYLNKDSNDILNDNFVSPIWTKAQINTDGTTNIKDMKLTNIAIKGQIPGKKTIKYHIDYFLPDGKAGDSIVSRLTRNDLEAEQREYIVSRLINGLVFEDINNNGIKDGNELLTDGVRVEIHKLKDKGDVSNISDYSLYNNAITYTGNEFDVYESKMKPYKKGEYQFTNLEKGIYLVKIINENNKLDMYNIAIKDAGKDDSLDSDATAVLDNGIIKHAYIENILMPEATKIQSSIHGSYHHDLGIVPKSYTIQINVYDKDDKPLPNLKFDICEDKECKVVLETIITNANGSAKTDLKKYSEDYYIKQKNTSNDLVLLPEAIKVSGTNKDNLNANGITANHSPNDAVFIDDSKVTNFNINLKLGETIEILETGGDGWSDNLKIAGILIIVTTLGVVIINYRKKHSAK